MTQSRTIVLASRNKKKAREVTEILAPAGFVVIPVTDFPDVPEVEEDGQTFAENAAKKASEIAVRLNRWVIGEDSGLQVDALGGAPGIYSARYSGPGATDELNNQKTDVRPPRSTGRETRRWVHLQRCSFRSFRHDPNRLRRYLSGANSPGSQRGRRIWLRSLLPDS